MFMTKTCCSRTVGGYRSAGRLLAMFTMLTVLFLPLALGLENDTASHSAAVGACTGMLLILMGSQSRPRSRATNVVTVLILSAALIVASVL